MEYLTTEDFKTAEANGIGYWTAYARVYQYGWPVEKAITKPAKKRSDALWPQYKDQCEKTGITDSAFYARIKAGMTPEQAATEPRQIFGRKKNVKVTQELQDIAAKNGISRNTLMRRVHVQRWSIKRATTEPVHANKRRKL